MAVELPDELVVNTDVITMGAWEEIEDITGRSYSAVLQLLGQAAAEAQPGYEGERQGVPMKVQRALIYATLKSTTMPELTFEDLADVTLTAVLQAQGILDAEGNPGPRMLEALAQAGEEAPDPTSTPSESSSGPREA